MGNFLSYTDVPIFANFVAENQPVDSSSLSGFFAATSASLSIDPRLVQNRFVNINQDKNNFSHDGPVEAKFSFTFYPLIEDQDQTTLNLSKINQLAFFNLTGSFESGHHIKLSNLTLKKCFLQNYSIKIEPFKPISVTSNFIVYDLSASLDQTLQATANISSIYKNSNIPNYKTLHGASTKMIDYDVYGKVKTSIDISVDTVRVPVYTIGEKYPQNVFLKTVERTTAIRSENIGGVIDYDGGTFGAAALHFMPYSSSFSNVNPEINSVLSFNISGRVFSQQISVKQNDIIEGSIVIKEIIL